MVALARFGANKRICRVPRNKSEPTAMVRSRRTRVMRHGMPLAIAWLVVIAASLSAQERIPLPAPDPAPAGSLLPPPSPLSPQAPASPTGPPQPYAPPPSSDSSSPPPAYQPPGPYAPYAPPPGLYQPPNSTPLFVAHSFSNPSLWLGVEGLVWWTKNQPLS